MHILLLCNFVSDRPDETYEVDHIDRDRQNNNIENLRWVTKRINAENKEDRIKLNDKLFSEIYYMHENPYKLAYDTVHHRIFKYKWSIEKAFNTPSISKGEKTENRIKGQTKRRSELRNWFEKQENHYNVSFKTFCARIRLYGYSKEEAINKPK